MFGDRSGRRPDSYECRYNGRSYQFEARTPQRQAPVSQLVLTITRPGTFQERLYLVVYLTHYHQTQERVQLIGKQLKLIVILQILVDIQRSTTFYMWRVLFSWSYLGWNRVFNLASKFIQGVPIIF